MKKLDYLIEYLLNEKNEKLELSDLTYEEKKRIFRSLCNIREPKEVSDEFLKIQNTYLQENLLEEGIVENIENFKITDTIYLWKGDITTLKIDAIVNAANSQGLGCFIPCHKCIDNAIHSASGVQLRLECYKKMKDIGELETGKAFITKGYNLPSKYVIHTVGPIIYDDVSKKDIEDLRNCYINSLKLAKENNIKEIAFCCISTGEFRFPKDEACKIAIETVSEYLKDSSNFFDKIVFNVFTDEDYNIYFNDFFSSNNLIIRNEVKYGKL